MSHPPGRPIPESAPPPGDDRLADVTAGAAFEEYPLTRNEYITSLVHFYRAEMARTDMWRTRMDTTTNWAVVMTAGILSFSFGNPDSPHVVLILSNLFSFAFLCFEARRFRTFDVWRARCRMFEENFFIPIIRRNLVSPMADWRDSVAEDLDRPTYKLSFLEAFSLRLRRNYLWLFLMVLVGWLLRLSLYPTPAEGPGTVYARMAIGFIPPWAVLGATLSAYAALTVLALRGAGHRRVADEIAGVQTELEHWKV